MKKLLYSLLYYCGGLHLWHWARRRHVTIVFFHSVLPSDERALSWKPCRTTIPSDTLRELTGFLARHYTFVSLEDAVGMLKGDLPSVPNAMAFTIDDGYLNTRDVALPVLQEFGVEPTVYAVSDNLVAPTAFWFDRLDFVVQKIAAASETLRFAGVELALNPQMSSEDLRWACNQVIDSSHEMAEDERASALDAFIREWEQRLASSVAEQPSPDLPSATMNALELAEADRRGLNIGSHTVSHRRLSQLSDDEIVYELRSSREHIQQAIGKPCKHLAYPEGFFDARVTRQTRLEGYDSAVTTQEGTNAPGCDLYELKRAHLSDFGSNAVLWSNMAGLNAFWSRLRGD